MNNDILEGTHDYEPSLFNMMPKKSCPKCGGVLLVLSKFETCRHCKNYSRSLE